MSRWWLSYPTTDSPMSSTSSVSSTSTPSSKTTHATGSAYATNDPRRILVIGGNGYVGSHILKELYQRSRTEVDGPLHLASLSRRGKPPTHPTYEPWYDSVEWHTGDVLASDTDEKVKTAMRGCAAVISCVGGFGNVETMERINGDANVKAILTANELGVPRFVYISAHHYQLPQIMQKGYFAGKFKAERALVETYGSQGVQIRPAFIHGTRQVGPVGAPLWLIGKPLQALTSLGFVRSLIGLPLVGPVLALPLTPPSSVEAVARAAVNAALTETPKKTIIEVDDLQRYE